MDASAHIAPTAQRMGVHRRALMLAATLFALFLIATGLTARYGYPLVLKVYEKQQIGTAAGARGAAKRVNYEDYLRVDPDNARVKKLLDATPPATK